ncbi:MAG TPA: hypothetical protein VKY82_00710 [Flavobacterium sp.]|nr:hypothetical protein [Flavobacterium sp.]
MLIFEKYYHIYNHANGNENLFREQKNYEYFLEKYKQHINPIAETIAWCLMPNHFHLLVKIKTEEEIVSTSFQAFPKFGTLEKLEKSRKLEKLKKLETLEAKSNFLSKQFANFFSSYTQSFNKVYGRRGSLFLKNFKRKEILDENYLRNLILYIHLNPLKHGFTNDILDWKWNSYQSFPVVHKEMFRMLFADEENYEYMHRGKQSCFKEYESLENELT